MERSRPRIIVGDLSAFRFGLTTGPRWSWREAADEWARLDAADAVDELWVVDHVAARNEGDRRFEAWSFLAGLAARTSRVRLGVLVSPITLRHPALLALAAATVDEISAGRLEIGLGAGGGLAADAHVVEAPDLSPRERVERLDDYAALVDAILRGEGDVTSGSYSTRGAAPRPSVQRPRPPITIAGDGMRVLEVVARRADRWVSLGGAVDSAGARLRGRGAAIRHTARQNARLDEILVSHGRRPDDVRRAVNASGSEPDPLSSAAAFEDFTLAYRSAGITDLMLPLVPLEDARRATFEQIVGELMPRLKA